jgi:hypothetical protein
MFLPFHFGPGIAIKSLMPRQFSLSIFAFSNLLMDVEPLYRMWFIKIPIHVYSHTLAGALLIGVFSALAGRFVLFRLWQVYQHMTHASELFQISKRQAWSSATVGVTSHLLLDATMYQDIHPFAPFSDANPLLILDWMLPIHFACLLAATLGMLLILIRAAFQLQRTSQQN